VHTYYIVIYLIAFNILASSDIKLIGFLLLVIELSMIALLYDSHLIVHRLLFNCLISSPSDVAGYYIHLVIGSLNDLILTIMLSLNLKFRGD
jgi:hypothetical protein